MYLSGAAHQEGEVTVLRNRKTLKRERINKLLEIVFDYPLIIVEAPMGYGKTTAVREFLAVKNSQVLWLAFLSPDSTTSFFWERLAKELGKLDEVAGERLQSLGFPSDAPQLAQVLSILNNTCYEENTVLVLDDFHLVKHRQIGEFLAQLVKEELDGLHIILITRDTTNLDLVELTAKRLCNIISQQQLRFNDQEIRDYCKVMGYSPGESDLAKIIAYTGGWVSLLYLNLLGLKNGLPVGSSSAIDDLLERVLYSAYDQRIQQFLLRLAAMDSFTAEQALFVSGESRSAEFLKKLRRENTFITYDEAARAYKIHNVLLDFLRNKRQHQVEMRELYRRVAEWHLKQKEYETAYAYFYRAGETERILQLLNNEDNVTLELAEFEGWFEMFATVPREVLFKYPLAYLQYICVMLFTGVEGATKDCAGRLDEFQAVYAAMEPIHSSLKKRILAETSISRIFIVFNDVDKMVDCIKKAAELLDGGYSCLIRRRSEFTFGSPHLLYSYYKEPGRLNDTAGTISSGFSSFAEIADGCGTGCDYLALAEYALETGDWPAAELNAYKAVYKAKTKGQTGIAICANFTLVRMYIFQGKVAEGLELLQQLREEVAREDSPIYNTTLDLCEGYVYGCLEQLDRMPLWLQSGDFSAGSFLFQGLGFNYIVYGKAVLLSGNYLELEILTEVFPQYFSIFNNQLGFIYNQIYEAAAKNRLYGPVEGCASLRKALDMAQADWIILPFAENAPAIIDILSCMAQSTGSDEYVRSVLFCCRQYLEVLSRTAPNLVVLTARELDVLALAAEGLKRGEIAGRLMVSTGTVRTHLGNIYQKLDVGGKIAAIKKAEKLKLI